MRCRICGATKNLIYAPAEITIKLTARLPLPLKEIANANGGNICKYCELRLENFHKEDSDAEIDVTDDERYCNMFFKRHYGHTAENGTVRSLGSDGDPDVIEVLTSRETTPDNGLVEMKPNVMPSLNLNPRIIDVIELDDDDDEVNCNIKPKISAVSLAEVTKTDLETNQRQENLLGCLNLVTSESESSEINFVTCQPKPLLPNQPSPPMTNKPTSPTNFPVCEVCGTRFLDTASQQVHMLDNHQLPCPVCATQLKTNLELIYHIRQKHREYNGEKLCEGAKCAQDSAMTIRLRYEQSATYYECQLCGNIDTQFKTHKQHIVQNHPHESKSLRDPMMKSKHNCPVCQQKFGIHPVDVCRHIILKHPEKSHKYLKEVTDLKPLPIKRAAHVQKIKDSSRILSFFGKDDRFYECNLCKKLFGNVRYFLTHLNAHNIQEWADYKMQKTHNKFDTSQRSKRKTDEHKAYGLKQKQMILPKKNHNNNISDNEHCQKLLKYKTPAASTKKLTPPKEQNTAANSKSKKQFETFKKPINYEVIAAASVEDNAIAKPSELKKQKKLKRRSKNDLTTKVKVKPPIRPFPTQKYTCKYCQKLFKGFRKLNLHLMQMHSEDEFPRCTLCPQQFMSELAIAEHVKSFHNALTAQLSKRKGQFIPSQTINGKVDENFNSGQTLKRPKITEKKTECKSFIGSNSKDSNNSSKAEQLQKTAHKVCQYCGRLFAKPSEFITHEKIHTSAKDLPWIAWDALIKD